LGLLAFSTWCAVKPSHCGELGDGCGAILGGDFAEFGSHPARHAWLAACAFTSAAVASAHLKKLE
jgi:hypothetical protein